MESITLLVNIISMFAAVVSCILAIKAKNKAKKISKEIENNFLNQNYKSGNEFNVSNSGKNTGNVGGVINNRGTKNG